MRALAIAGLVCAWLGHAAAQTPADIKRANELFLEGRELLTSNQTQAACDTFEESIKLDPTAPGVMLNLGLCYELLEKYATSLLWFRKAQVAAAEAHLTAYEEEAKRRTLTLVGKVSILKLDASAAPPETEIRIDGRLVEPTDYARVEIDLGEHQLEARAAGKQPYRHRFEVTAIDAGTIEIPPLDSEPIATVTPPVEPVEPESPASPGGRIALAASLAGAGVVLCIASPLWARHTKSTYDDAVAANEMPSYSSARTKQHVATGLFVAGLGLIGTGAYIYLTAPRGTVVTPLVGDGQVGIALSGAL